MSAADLPPKSAPLSERVAAAMERSELYKSQRALGKALGTDGSLVGKWLSGEVQEIRSVAHRRKLPRLLVTPKDYFSDPPRADRLVELEAKAATIEEVTDMLEPLREAIVLLANGDSAGALRVLLEADAS